MGYAASKALAERAAWDFVQTETPDFQLTTVCSHLALLSGERISPWTDLTLFFQVQSPYGLRPYLTFPLIIGHAQHL